MLLHQRVLECVLSDLAHYSSPHAFLHGLAPSADGGRWGLTSKTPGNPRSRRAQRARACPQHRFGVDSRCPLGCLQTIQRILLSPPSLCCSPQGVPHSGGTIQSLTSLSSEWGASSSSSSSAVTEDTLKRGFQDDEFRRDKTFIHFFLKFILLKYI